MLINAKQAKKMVEMKQKAKEIEELAEVEQLIHDAIDSRAYKAYVNYHLTEATKEQLKLLGYKIQTCGRYDENSTIISW